GITNAHGDRNVVGRVELYLNAGGNQFITADAILGGIADQLQNERLSRAWAIFTGDPKRPSWLVFSAVPTRNDRSRFAGAVERAQQDERFNRKIVLWHQRIVRHLHS